jgi:hypothetical protein
MQEGYKPQGYYDYDVSGRRANRLCHEGYTYIKAQDYDDLILYFINKIKNKINIDH